MERRSLLKMAAALSAYGVPVQSLLAGTTEEGRLLGESKSFDYAWLKGHARHLAAQAYTSHEGELPKTLRNLSWDDYKSIRFKPEKALWRDKDGDSDDENAFQIQFFHLGLYFQTPVKIYEVIDGQAREIAYKPNEFSYDGDQPLGDLPEDVGYAGFRVHFHTDFKRDLTAFLGASYFRAVGETMQYGMSARGLAIDTAVGDGKEEFPVFTAFWLEKPKPGSTRLTVYALLDSESITGAYAFDLYPGHDMVMDVSVALYPRKSIERIGIAPLTSMYQVGENHQRRNYDWRPEIHDSDGLSLWTGSGEWIWRPLNNPHALRVNSFADKNPRGFGLLQRDRDFDHYQDDSVYYNARPSVWVEPKGDWGKGAVMLVEIPTDDETFDNIVAFWNPEKPLEPGSENRFSYRLTWGNKAPHEPDDLAITQATRTGLGGVIGQKRQHFSWRFAVDFAGGMLSMIEEEKDVEPVITVSRGKVEITSARPLDAINGYRAMFDLVPDDSEEPIDIRLYLKIGDQPLTETWVYQYTPPPKDKRQVF